MLILHFLIKDGTKQQPPFGLPGFAKLTRENKNDEGITLQSAIKQHFMKTLRT
jgi:hypothetical protein